jgi:hypothetical protein
LLERCKLWKRLFGDDCSTHPLTAYGLVKSSSVSSKNGFFTNVPLALNTAACRCAMDQCWHTIIVGRE